MRLEKHKENQQNQNTCAFFEQLMDRNFQKRHTTRIVLSCFSDNNNDKIMTAVQKKWRPPSAGPGPYH